MTGTYDSILWIFLLKVCSAQRFHCIYVYKTRDVLILAQ